MNTCIQLRTPKAIEIQIQSLIVSNPLQILRKYLKLDCKFIETPFENAKNYLALTLLWPPFRQSYVYFMGLNGV